jgi:hypothetical protein
LISEYFSQKLFSQVSEIFVRRADDLENYEGPYEDEYAGGMEEYDNNNEQDIGDDPAADFEYGATAGDNKYIKMRKQREKEKKM